MAATDRPRLRDDLEFCSAEVESQPLLLLRDPRAFKQEYARFGPGALPILEYFDGNRSLEEIHIDLMRRGAGPVPLDELEGLVDILDRCFLLDNDRFRVEERERDEFLKAPTRRATHAGDAYPDEAADARKFLQRILEEADEAQPAPLRRLIAPHIDLRLGSRVYAHAHRRLAAAERPDVVVVLGVRHEAGTRRFIACRKDFETPLCPVRHDAPFLDALEKKLGMELTEEQLAHRGEHSVEFQALWLAHLWPEDPPAIVPLLVGSFHDLIEADDSPADDPEITAFIGALSDCIAGDDRRIVVLASVDLAHIGPIYDHAEGLDEEGEKRMEEDDREVLRHVEAGDAEEFYRAVAADGNARNICGLAPVYVTLRLGAGEGDLLRYGQGRIHPKSGSVVSFAALAFPK